MNTLVISLQWFWMMASREKMSSFLRHSLVTCTHKWLTDWLKPISNVSDVISHSMTCDMYNNRAEHWIIFTLNSHLKVCEVICLIELPPELCNRSVLYFKICKWLLLPILISSEWLCWSSDLRVNDHRSMWIRLNVSVDTGETPFSVIANHH